jgi:hypothetical protein
MNFAITCSTLCPRVVTLHNVIDHIYYSQDIPWYQQLNFAHIQNKPYHLIPRHRTDHIITVSQYSKQDIIQYLHISEDKITVIYEAADKMK